MSQTQPDTGVKYLLAFDVETTGPSPNEHFMPEFGAALIEVESGKELWRFHTYCAQPDGTKWEENTRTEFWLEKARTRYDAIVAALPTAPTREDAMRTFVRELRAALEEHAPDAISHNVLVISDTAGFDCSFMERAMRLDCGASSMRSLCDENVNQPLRDVNSIYLGIAGFFSTNDVQFRNANGKRMRPIELACHALGIAMPTTSCKHTHDPADDASHMAQCAAHVLRALRARQKQTPV